jgi:MFS family permease
MNPIQPITTRPREISVAEPVSPALERVKRVLFKPFDLGKWFTIGFCAWLAGLGESGGSGGGSFHSNFNPHHETNFGESFRQHFWQARDYVLDNLGWIIPLVALGLVIGLGLWLLFLWLNSRGKFMFLHCVVLDKAEVVEPWNQFAFEGNSLFLFRLCLGLIGMVLMLPFLGIAIVMVVKMFLVGQFLPNAIISAIGFGLLFLGMVIVFAIIKKLTLDFVVPIMFLRRNSCLRAWKELGSLISGHVGIFILYFLFQIVLCMAIGVIVLGAVLITCCIAGCLMILPYIGTVLLLPVLMFKRCYSLYFLAQFGREYDVFPPTAPPVPATPPIGFTT